MPPSGKQRCPAGASSGTSPGSLCPDQRGLLLLRRSRVLADMLLGSGPTDDPGALRGAHSTSCGCPWGWGRLPDPEGGKPIPIPGTATGNGRAPCPGEIPSFLPLTPEAGGGAASLPTALPGNLEGAAVSSLPPLFCEVGEAPSPRRVGGGPWEPGGFASHAQMPLAGDG